MKNYKNENKIKFEHDFPTKSYQNSNYCQILHIKVQVKAPKLKPKA